LLEVKKALVRKAYEEGRLLNPEDLTDESVFQLLQDDAAARSYKRDQRPRLQCAGIREQYSGLGAVSLGGAFRRGLSAPGKIGYWVRLAASISSMALLAKPSGCRCCCIFSQRHVGAGAFLTLGCGMNQAGTCSSVRMECKIIEMTFSSPRAVLIIM